MKIWSFIKWRWGKFEIWQKWYIASMLLVGAAIPTPAPYDRYLFLTGFGVILFFLAKFMFWDSIRDSYREYEKEKQNLIKLIESTEK